MREPIHRGTVASKKGGLVFSGGTPGELSGARIRDVVQSLVGLLDLGGREVFWYGCDDLRKIGSSDGRVALLNPRMPELPQDAVHLAVNVDRKVLKAPFEALVCAIEIAGRFTAFATGLGDAFPRAAIAWVPASAAIASAHPELSQRRLPRSLVKGQTSDAPFAHAFTAAAIQQEFSITGMIAGIAPSADKGLKKLVADIEVIRRTFETQPIELPVDMQVLADRVRTAAAATAPANLAA